MSNSFFIVLAQILHLWGKRSSSLASQIREAKPIFHFGKIALSLIFEQKGRNQITPLLILTGNIFVIREIALQRIGAQN